MRFVIAFLADQGLMAGASAEAREQIMKDFEAYSVRMAQEGVRRGGEALKPPAEGGKRVSIRDGKRIVLDGPFSETKEVLGGYYLIEVETPEQALEWAAQCPGVHVGTVELREVMPLTYNDEWAHR